MKHAKRTSLTVLAAVTVLVAVSSTALANKAVKAPWQVQANSACHAFFATTAAKQVQLALQSQALFSTDPVKRDQYADTLTELAHASLRTDRRLARVHPPAPLTRRYRHMIKVDRKANGRLPLLGADLIRTPATHETDTQIGMLMQQSEQLDATFEKIATKLGLKDCVSGEA